MLKKKLFIIFIIIITIILIAIVQTYYTRKATVIKIEDNIITVEDKIGNYWKFEGEGYKIGEHITLVMNTNSTENYVSDDVIVHTY